MVVGRVPPADVTVRDRSLSRQHATVELLEGEVWIEDLRSTNGTWVNGERIERIRLEAGAELALGTVRRALREGGVAGAVRLLAAPRYEASETIIIPR